MIINRSFKNFKFRHRSKKNQIIYTSKKVSNDNDIINLIDNFLSDKNSFIFESVEKGKIKGRYTIFGKNPDKIWEFNNNNSYLIKNKKKFKLKRKPQNLIETIIEEFKFKIPSHLPPISSLISGYFSYDSIRYIEKIPNKCKDDIKVPDVRLLRPRTLVIHDNLKKKIFYIINVFHDEHIKNYANKYLEIKSELSNLLVQSSKQKISKILSKKLDKIKIRSNTSKNTFMHMVNKAKKYIARAKKEVGLSKHVRLLSVGQSRKRLAESAQRTRDLGADSGPYAFDRTTLKSMFAGIQAHEARLSYLCPSPLPLGAAKGLLLKVHIFT